jgi:hypothetical protein
MHESNRHHVTDIQYSNESLIDICLVDFPVLYCIDITYKAIITLSDLGMMECLLIK